VVTVGPSALGKPFTAEHVHRPEIYARLSGLQEGDEISIEAMVQVLCHPCGGLKNILPKARRIALLNQVDTPELRSSVHDLADRLFPAYHSVAVASLLAKENPLTIS
jgi:probable selenium-dependent hydroxylase accessory protein YqeC